MTYPLTPFKRLLARNDGGVWGEEPDGLDDTLVLRSTEQSADGHWIIDNPAPRKLNAIDAARYRLQCGDLLVTKSSGSSNHIGKTTFVTQEVASLRPCYSNFMQRLRISTTDNAKFYWYVLRTRETRDQMAFYSTTSTGLANLNATILGELSVPHPPIETQFRIVEFLDRETAQIDGLIGKQEQLLELLAEKRQAIITHAVTRGLDPTTPTKPSGITWLGDIPEAWRTAELKRALTFITSGSRGWAEFYADRGTPFVRIGNLTRGHIHLDMSETQHVDIPRDSEGTRAVVEADDVLFSITAYLGSVAVASEEESGSYVSQHVALTRLDQNRLQSRFLAYFVLSEFGQRQLDEGAYGGTKLQLSLEDIKRLRIPVPGISEQIEIARHLDAATTRIDALLELARNSISLLLERRSALISAAVTGKINVEAKEHNDA